MDLDKIMALADAATKGPWKLASYGFTSPIGITGYARRATDREFIAWTREGVPALVAELKAARENIWALELKLESK